MTARADQVAIIGFAGRFPGAPSIDALWEMLRAGGDGRTVFTDEELASAGVPAELIADPSYVKARFCLDGIETFDAQVFGFLPAEAALLDPQQRIFLECAWEALEHAGYGQRSRRPRAGVFASASASRYLLHLIERLGPSAREPFALDGVLTDFLAPRAAYKLDLQGPAVTVLTACSSSLVALHLACQSLLLGEADLALAGASSVAVPNREGRLWQPGSIASRDGRCRPFDAEASGTVGGDAAVVVVLRRLEDAVRDRDFIHSIVRATAVNNDGASKAGFTAPGLDAQARVVSDALHLAGVAPRDIGFVEAHGSGTELGDPIEIEALAQAFAGTEAGRIPIGSIKANIGHTDAAAGLCGVVKASLCLRERTLVPTPGFRHPSPRIDFSSTPFRVQAVTEPWPAAGARLAGVSSFGMGGTNAHAVLEEPPPRPLATPDARPWHLLVLSARTRAALERSTTGLAEHLQAHPELPLGDVAFTLQVGREPFAHRRFVVARSAADAAVALARRDPARVLTASCNADGRHDRPSMAFLFPGLGDTDLRGAADLYRHAPAFRASFDACAERLASTIGVDVRTLLSARPARDPFSRWVGRGQEESLSTVTAQTALFATTWALYTLWTSIGVLPDVLAGHSLGEYVAATAAGLFSVEDALSVVAGRARLVDQLPRGAMTAVGMSAEELSALGVPGVSIAAVNGKAVCVAGGAPADIEVLETRLETAGISHRRLDVRHAFHTPLLQPAADRLAELIERTHRSRPRLPFYSCATGALHDDTSATDAKTWSQHLIRPVMFAPALEELAADPARVFVQVGPGAQLVRLARLAGGGARATVTASSLPEDGDEGLHHWLHAVGTVWLAGARIEWSRLDETTPHSRLPLPTYPFERKRYWVDGAPPPQPAPREMPPKPAHARAIEPARDERERAMLEIWRASFGFDHIGLHDSFFDLGGHSLLALQLLFRLRRSLGVDLSVRDLIECPTVAALASRCGSSTLAPSSHRLDGLRGKAPAVQRELAESYMTDEVARALGRPPDEVRRAGDLGAMGLADNLADLVRVLKRDLSLVVYPHELLARPTVAGLGSLLLEAMGLAPAAAPPPAEDVPTRHTVSPPVARRNPPVAFILSSARSGSTLLRLMLAGHPRLFCPPELHLLMHDTLRQRQQRLSSSHFGKGLPRTLMELCATSAAGADAMVAGWLERDLTIPEVYRELQTLARPRLLVDKSPSYAEDAATLRRMDDWFSSSYPIVLLRHPVSVMESYVRTRMASMARATFSDPWEQAEHHWLHANRNLMELLDEAPRPAHVVRYEDLVTAPEPTLRALCASLGVEYHPAVTEPYGRGRMIDGVGDPNIHEHDGIERGLAEAWRRVRPPRPLREETRRLAERFGYELPEGGA